MSHKVPFISSIRHILSYICNPNREVSEWFKEHAWKACIRQRIGGSNPFLSAKPVTKVTGFFRLRQRRKLAFESWRERKKTEANEVCF